MVDWTQANRDISIWTRYNELQKKEKEDEPDVICLLAVEGHEYVSKPFLYKCIIECTIPGLRIAEGLVGTWATIRIRYRDPFLGPSDSYVYLPRSGVIRTCKPVYSHDTGLQGDPKQPSDDTVRTYVVEMVPWFSFLDLITDFRIFQDSSVVDILKEVMDEEINTYKKSWTVDDLYDLANLKDKYPKLEYCVQNRETTFDFLSRLMEEFGIFYYFDHSGGGMANAPPTIGRCKLVLCEKNKDFYESMAQPVVVPKPPDVGDGWTPEARNEASADTWNHRWQPRSHEWTLGRANFAHPDEPIRGDDHSVFGMTNYSRYYYPDRAVDVEDEKKRATRAEELEIIGREVVFGSSSDWKSFMAGGSFIFSSELTLNEDKDFAILPEEFQHFGPPGPNSPIPVNNRKYALVQVDWTASEPYENETGKAIAQVLQDDLSPGGAIPAGFNQLTQQSAPPTVGNQYDVPYNYLAWFGAGILSKLVSDIFTVLFKKPQPTFNVLFTAVPLESRYVKPPPDTTGEAFPLPYRPDKTSPKPRINGPLLGVVVKDPNSAAQEVCVDQFGRVRVRFWWDRSWPPWPTRQDRGKKPQRMTAWLRVAEGWADNKWGTYFPARIGQEVIVSFIDGDPDRPIVTGRVYNGTHPPPFLQPGGQYPTLPPGAMKPSSVKVQTELHYSGIKTQSTPKPSGNPNDTVTRAPPSRFHLLRFDDTWGTEQYLIRSQGRLDMTVFNNRYENIGNNRNLTVGGKSYKDGQPLEIHGDYVAKIFKHYYLHVGDPDFLAASGAKSSGNRVTHIEQNDELQVGKGYMLDAGTYSAVTGDYYLHVAGRSPSSGTRTTIIDNQDLLHVKSDQMQWLDSDWFSTVGKDVIVVAKGQIWLQSDKSISLVVGKSAIQITPSAIVLESPLVQATQQVQLASAPPPTPIAPSSIPSPPAPADPKVDTPHNPTNADPGGTFTPPPWQPTGQELPP